jgi:hypothetical protein
VASGSGAPSVSTRPLESESNPRITKKSCTPLPVPTFTPLTFLRASPSTMSCWLSMIVLCTTLTLVGVFSRSSAIFATPSAGPDTAGRSPCTSTTSP